MTHLETPKPPMILSNINFIRVFGDYFAFTHYNKIRTSALQIIPLPAVPARELIKDY